MPKISAPTVAEHRALQRAALVRAGEEVLEEGGLAGFSAGAVAERAGMARSSFYDYFSTKDDLLVAIAIKAIERWGAAIEKALREVPPGPEQLEAFVKATMTMTADRKHAIAGLIRDAELSPSHMEDLMTLHEALLKPATDVLEHVGVEASRSRVALMQGVLDAGMKLVMYGQDPDQVSADVYRVLTHGVLGA